MISRSYQQFAIVRGDTAQQLTDQLNAKIRELRGKDPTVTFDGMIAHIKYTEREDVPETLADEYELKGVRLRCEDCPMFQPVMKADGTIDKRMKNGGCDFAEYGFTSRTYPACDELFRMINDKEVRLCLASTESEEEA